MGRGCGRWRSKAFRRRYTLIVKAGYAANPDPDGRPRNKLEREAHNLLRRLDTQRADICRYWTNPAVAATNNQAERDLRMSKLQVKISGCFRSMIGAQAFAAIRSYIQTAMKRNKASTYSTHSSTCSRANPGSPLPPAQDPNQPTGSVHHQRSRPPSRRP